MKKIAAAVAVLALLGLALMHFAQADEPTWSSDLPAALTVAQTAHKPVLLVLGSEMCPWCDKLEKETLKDPAVVTALQGYAIVKVDVGQNHALGSKYAREGVPQTVILGDHEELLGQITGYVPPAVMLAQLKQGQDNYKLLPEIATLETTLKGKPDDAPTLARLGGLYVSLEQYTKAEPLLKQALQQRDKLDPVVVAGAELDTLIASLPRRNGEVASDFAAWIKANRSHPRLIEAQYYGGYAAALKGDGKSALSLWNEVITAQPDSALGVLAKHYSDLVKRAMSQRNSNN